MSWVHAGPVVDCANVRAAYSGCIGGCRPMESFSRHECVKSKVHFARFGSKGMVVCNDVGNDAFPWLIFSHLVTMPQGVRFKGQGSSLL